MRTPSRGKRARSAFFTQPEQDLGVGLGAKTMAAPFELLAELNVVEDLAVERDPDRFVVVRHRLRAAANVNNAEPGVRESGARLEVHSAGVRAAMMQHRHHVRQDCGDMVVAIPRDDAGDAAHAAES